MPLGEQQLQCCPESCLHDINAAFVSVLAQFSELQHMLCTEAGCFLTLPQDLLLLQRIALQQSYMKFLHAKTSCQAKRSCTGELAFTKSMVQAKTFSNFLTV